MRMILISLPVQNRNRIVTNYTGTVSSIFDRVKAAQAIQRQLLPLQLGAGSLKIED
jgi:hypothetical protein